MTVKPKTIAMLVIMQAMASMSVACAQNNNWPANQQNLINQDAAAGVLTSGQAAVLQNKDAAIQAQEQQYLNQHGGTLTRMEQRKINREMKGVNKDMGNDLKQDAQLNGQIPPQWRNGQMPPQWQNGQMPSQWQQNSQMPPQWQNGQMPAQGQNGNMQPGQGQMGLMRRRFAENQNNQNGNNQYNNGQYNNQYNGVPNNAPVNNP